MIFTAHSRLEILRWDIGYGPLALIRHSEPTSSAVGGSQSSLDALSLLRIKK
jgi:hypothetical protein